MCRNPIWKAIQCTEIEDGRHASINNMSDHNLNAPIRIIVVSTPGFLCMRISRKFNENTTKHHNVQKS